MASLSTQLNSPLRRRCTGALQVAACVVASLVIEHAPLWAQSTGHASLIGDHQKGWASQLAGKLDLLFVVSEDDSTDAREIALQLDADIRFLDPGELESTEDVLDHIGDSDALITSAAIWEQLSSAMQQVILNRCREGLGLVVLGDTRECETLQPLDEAEPDVMVRRLVDDDSTSMWLSNLGARLNVSPRVIGDGRVIAGNTPLHSSHHTLLPTASAPSLLSKRFYDYQLATVLRAILWAAQYEASAIIKKLERIETAAPSKDEIPPQLPPEYMQYMSDAQARSVLSVFVLELESPAQEDVSVSVRFRRDDDAHEWEAYEVASIPKGGQSAVMHLPLGRGSTTLDVWVEDGGDLCDWISERVELERWPMLEEVEFSEHLVDVNDAIEVTYTVRPNHYAPSTTYAHLTVADTLGRVIAYQVDVVPPEGGTRRSRVVWTDAMTRALRVDVNLSEDNPKSLSAVERRLSDHAHADLVVRNQTDSGLLWSVPHEVGGAPFHHGALSNLRKSGVNLIQWDGAVASDTALLESNLGSVVDYPTLPELTGGDSACLATPTWRQWQFGVVGNWRNWAAGLGIRHVLFDWTAEASMCDCDECTTMTQERLKSYYPNLDALNRSWDTSFTAWSAVMPTDGVTSIAQQTDLGRSRLERYAHAENEMVRLLETSRSEMQTVALLEDTDTAGVPDRIARTNLSIGPSNPVSSAKLRSYRRGNHSTGLWSEDSESAGLLPWQALFEGHAIIRTPATFSGDEEFLASLALARSGFDALILASAPQHASIGVYENDSTWLSATTHQRALIARTQRAVTRALRDLGLPFRFVSYDQLVSGDASESSIVLVPRVSSLSQEERAAFATFVRNGGSVISDSASGELDEHGSPSDTSGLKVGSVLDFDDVDSVRAALEVAADDYSLPRSSPNAPTPEHDASASWSRLRFGEADIYVGLQSDPADVERPTVTIDEGRYAYDLFSGKLLKARKDRLSVNAWGASMMTELPYRVSRIVAEAPEVVAAGQRLPFAAAIKTFDTLPGDHLIRVRLVNPEGQPLPIYDTVITCANGEGRGYIPLALNEAVGRYTLELYDLLSGVSASIQVRVL